MPPIVGNRHVFQGHVDSTFHATSSHVTGSTKLRAEVASTSKGAVTTVIPPFLGWGNGGSLCGAFRRISKTILRTSARIDAAFSAGGRGACPCASSSASAPCGLPQLLGPHPGLTGSEIDPEPSALYQVAFRLMWGHRSSIQCRHGEGRKDWNSTAKVYQTLSLPKRVRHCSKRPKPQPCLW